MLYDFIKTFQKVILFPFQLISEKTTYLMKSIHKTLNEKQIKRKNRNEIKKLKRILMSDHMTSDILHYFILSATAGLQFISFFTTYSGTNYYFGNLTYPKFLGPFIITCVIQFSVFLLSNLAVDKDNFTNGKKGMLAFFLAVSILFSYTGMIHVIVKPYKTMKINYDDFMNKYEDVFHLYLSQNQKNEDVSSYYASKTATLEKVLESQITSAKAILDSIPHYDTLSSTHSSSTNQNGETTTTSSNSQSINPKWIQYNNQYLTLKHLKEELNNQYMNIEKQLSEALIGSEESILKALSALSDDLQTTYNTCIDTLNHLDIQISSLTYLDNYETVYYQIKNQNQLKEYKLLTYEQIEKQVQDTLLSHSNMEYYSAIGDKIQEEIEIFEKTPLYTSDDLTSFRIDKDKLNEVQSASQKAKNIQDFHLLALSYLNPSNYLFFKAVMTFLFAAFIDLTTFFMPYLMEKRKRNILYMNCKKEKASEEELLNSLLESVYKAEQIQIKSEKIREELESFISMFSICSNEELEDGFSLRCLSCDFDCYLQDHNAMRGFIVLAIHTSYIFKDSTHVYHENEMIFVKTNFVLWIQNILAVLSAMI